MVFSTLLRLANLLTFLRLFLIPVFIFFFQADMMLHALTVFFLAILTDILDGRVARRQGVTSFGRFADPITDQLLMSAIFICFTTFKPVEGGLIPIWMVTIIVGLEFFPLIILGFLKIKYQQVPRSSEVKWGKRKGASQIIIVTLSLVSLYFRNDSNMAFVARSYGPIFFISLLPLILSVVTGVEWAHVYYRYRYTCDEDKRKPA